MAELDELLSESLKRVAVPGDPSGVAERIRARADAGDPGLGASSSTAPGWGGSAAAGWLPWIGLVVVAGLVGAGAGWSGIAGAATDEVAVVGTTSLLDATVAAGSCPGGPVVRELAADTRVLAVARTEDSGYLGVRNPDDVVSTIWVPASIVVPDAGQDVAELPVGPECPTVTVTVPQPAPVETPTPEPTKPQKPTEPAPPPAGDTTAPVFGTMSTPTCTTVAIKASDNVGVTSVSVSASGANTLVATQLHLIKGTWKTTIAPALAADGDTTFTFVARDAAGNTATTSTTVNLPCGGPF